jgi:PKD repeat protein
MKKLNYLLAVALLCALMVILPASAADEPVAAAANITGNVALSPSAVSYSGGSGTETDPYRISTGADLITLSTDSDNWEKYFILTDDISLSAGSPTGPIGINSSIYFNGSFDGQGYTISDFTMNKSDSNYIGLFGYLGTGAQIKDLRVEAGADGVTGNWYVGVLVGYSKGTVVNCSAGGNATANNYAGGLIGYTNDDGTITNCYATGSATANDKCAGGLVGKHNEGIITNSYATGSASTAGDYAGGLIGYTDDDGTITNCYATGNAAADRYVGGLIGYTRGTVSDCYATGNATATGDWAGGLIGYSKETITNCSATGNVVADNSAGGLVGRNCDTVTNCSATGSATATAKRCGGFVAHNDKGTIMNCSATGNATADTYAGGFVGYNDLKSTISDCYATGSATANDKYAGGFAGFAQATIMNSYSTGNATASNYAGGLLGYAYAIVTNCYATGSATASNGAGGFAGYAMGTITNCYATGDATATADESAAGGFAGLAKGTIINSYAIGNATADTYAGGFIGQNSNSTITNCYRHNGNAADTDGTQITDPSTFRDYAFLTGTESGNGLNWSTDIISTEADSSKIWKAFADKSNYPVFQWQVTSPVPDTPVIGFGPESASVIESRTTEIDVTVSSLPEGLSGYNLTVTVDDPAIADITGISYPSWVTVTENSSLPGSPVYLAALDGGENIQPGAEDVVLATLTVSGKDMGLANLSIGVHRLDDDEGYRIEPELATGEVEVTLFTLPDQDNSPRDLDGDGLYEDLTGNGEFSFVDIVAYFHNIDWIDDNLPTEFFDFNKNGRIDFDDIVDMFQMLD